MKPAYKDEDGFILLEVLVGLALLSLVATATGSLLSMGSRRTAQVREAKSGIEQIVVARLVLQGLVDAITLVSREEPAVHGTAKRIAITSHGLPAFGLVKPARFELMGENGKGLLLAWTDPEKGIVHSEELARGSEASFAFFGANSDHAVGWYNDWNTETMPKLVSVTIKQADGQTRQFILEIRTDVFDTCLVHFGKGCSR